jgi:hypothetical protein
LPSKLAFSFVCSREKKEELTTKTRCLYALLIKMSCKKFLTDLSPLENQPPVNFNA